MAGTAVLRILLKMDDAASKGLAAAGKSGERAGQLIRDNWKQATAALSATALAAEAYTRKQAETEEALSRVAARTGEANDAVRDMALELSNVTFPLDQAVGLLEIATQRGLESREELEAFAATWDTIGDATGESSEELAKAASALSGLGVDAGETEQALDAFGFVTANTTSTVGDFLEFVSRTSGDLSDLGLDVNETAGLLGALERELGLSGRAARTEFNEAVIAAEGNLEVLLDQLGLTEDQLVEYTAQVEGSSRIIDENAQIHADSFTTLQKAQHWLSELAFQYSEQIRLVGNLAPALVAAGPALRGFVGVIGMTSTAFNVMKIAAITAWGAAFSPVTLIVLAIAGIAAGIILLIEHWEKFADVGREAFRLITDAINFYINHTYQPAINTIIKGINAVLDFLGLKTIPELKKLNIEGERIFDSMTVAIVGFRETAHEKLDEIKASVFGTDQQFQDLEMTVETAVPSMSSNIGRISSDYAAAAGDIAETTPKITGSLELVNGGFEEGSAAAAMFAESLGQARSDVEETFAIGGEGEGFQSSAEWAQSVIDSAASRLEAGKEELTNKAVEVVEAVDQVFIRRSYLPNTRRSSGPRADARAAFADGPLHRYNPETGKFDLEVGPGDPFFDRAFGSDDSFGQPSVVENNIVVNAPNFVGDNEDLAETVTQAIVDLQEDGAIEQITR